MAKISVSEAARKAGISRSYLYRKYIKPGLITVERDREEKPVIDTAEILRVFGRIQGDSDRTVESGHVDTPKKDSSNDAIQLEVRLLREQLAAAAEREKWLQGKVDQLTGQLDNTTRLLEHRTIQEQPQKRKKFLGIF